MFRAPPRDIENAGSKKRQKMSFDVEDEDMKVDTDFDPEKNAHLKGRRRFNADLRDIGEASLAGMELHGLRLQKATAGDDEGSVEIVIADSLSRPILPVNLLVSDTSEYPSSHSLFSYSPDYDLPAKFQRIVDAIADEPSRPLGKTVIELMASVAAVVGHKVHAPAAMSIEGSDGGSGESDDGSEDYDAFDEYDEMDTGHDVEPNTILRKIQEDFVDIVATQYRPGFIRIGGNDFIISVSLPVISLADSIPPRALMAWDRRLLSSSQHLTLLIGGFRALYPVLENDGTYTASSQRFGVSLTFKVGLSQRYKPGSTQVQDIVRKHSLIIQDAEDELRKQAELAAQKPPRYDPDDEDASDNDDDGDDSLKSGPAEQPEVEEVVDPDGFDRFSLSNSLESLMDQSFLVIVQLRKKFSLGWAGAELLQSEIEKSQRLESDVFASMEQDLRKADADERKLGRTTILPHDPLLGVSPSQPFNLPLAAFCYLIRRLSLCTRYCIVCHNKLQTDYQALKPYVCDSKLCAYQYYFLNRGPSLEYEILHNPKTVDLLVSLAYVSACEGAMEAPLPVGLGLRVPPPSVNAAGVGYAPAHGIVNNQNARVPTVKCGADGLCDFDDLDLPQMRSCIARLIHTLPSVDKMKKHLERKVGAGTYKPKLKDINPKILPAAWLILRWSVASCTAHIEAIDSVEERIRGLDSTWSQFRMTVGAPDAEAKFTQALKEEMVPDANMEKYPVIYAFHGSPLKNWHSIIRHGLWYRSIAHGRAYGDGVYLAKDATTSMGMYASSGKSAWINSASLPASCMALAEVINRPNKFVSSDPHYVIKDTHWIMCRYLLVKTGGSDTELPTENLIDSVMTPQVPFVRLDPKHQTAVSRKIIEIPDPAYKVETLLSACKRNYVHQDADEEDMAIFKLDTAHSSSSHINNFDLDDDGDYTIPAVQSLSKGKSKAKPSDDWKCDLNHVMQVVGELNLPPFKSSPSASMAIQRELKAMFKEQDAAPSLRELGWYMPPELIGDNLYQWIVELHSFDQDLPLAKDMKRHKQNSIIFEIRFPATFPNSPPFFRIITPRFLPFIQGGGGHVTGGGSICMDLLTSDGWLPSYSISAVLMQIRLALSNLEPRPARLSADWHRPYGVLESLEGYKRAAATHRWTLPEGIERLVR